MKNILSLISISSLLLVLAACGSKQAPTAEEIVAKARAVKTLNAYDEMSCVVYEMKGFPESPQTSIDRFISDDCVEGTGSFELKYSFSGNASGTESVYIQQSGGDYRSDLSFHPLGLSIWVKGNKNNKGTFRFMLIQDVDQFARVFAAAKRSGGELTDIISQTAGIIRDKIQVQEEIHTLTAARVFEQKIMNGIPFGIILYIDFTSPGFFHVMYETWLGRIFMTACLGIYVGAVFLAKKILDIPL